MENAFTVSFLGEGEPVSAQLCGIYQHFLLTLMGRPLLGLRAVK